MRPGTIDYQASLRREMARRLKQEPPKTSGGVRDAADRKEASTPIRKPRRTYGGAQ